MNDKQKIVAAERIADHIVREFHSGNDETGRIHAFRNWRHYILDVFFDAVISEDEGGATPQTTRSMVVALEERVLELEKKVYILDGLHYLDDIFKTIKKNRGE